MNLPDPQEVKRLMSSASNRVRDIIVQMRMLADQYGVHGDVTTCTGDLSFQLTRINERWSVYVFPAVGSTHDLEGAKLDEKILFLEQADQFQAAYAKRILGLYEKLKKMEEKEGVQ